MKVRALAVGAGLLLSASVAAPASAQVPVCAGTASTAFVCVDPTGGSGISDCIYVGAPPCIPVTAPTPTAGCGGDLLDPVARCRF